MPIGKPEGALRLDAETAIILREAFHRSKTAMRCVCCRPATTLPTYSPPTTSWTILRKYELDSRAQVADDVRRYLAR